VVVCAASGRGWIMTAPVWDIGAGLVLHAPVSVITNIAIAFQALWLTRGGMGRGGWGLAIRVLGVAAAVGAVKHATGPGGLHEVARVASNLAIALALLVPAWSVFAGHAKEAPAADVLRAHHHERLALGLFTMVFLIFAAITAMAASFGVVVGFCAAAVIPIVVDETRAWPRGHVDARRILAGLGVGALAGAAYLVEIRVGRWVGPIDVAHFGFMAALPLLAGGHRARHRRRTGLANARTAVGSRPGSGRPDAPRLPHTAAMLVVLAAGLVLPSGGATQEPSGPATVRLGFAPGESLVVPPPLGVNPVHGLAAGCGSAPDPDSRTVAVADVLARLAPDAYPERLVAALDSMASAFASDPSHDPLRRRHHEALLLGARVETLGGRDRVEATRALHASTSAILEDAPDHAGARHILGRINAAVMRLGGTRRFLARVVIGGDLLGSASWDAAREHLEHAERVGPCMAEHHLELGLLLADTGDEAGAHIEAWHVLALARVATLSAERATMLRTKALELLSRP